MLTLEPFYRAALKAKAPPPTVSIPALYSDVTSLWKMDEDSGDALDSVGGQDGTDVDTVGSAAGLVDGARLMVKTSGEYFSIPDSLIYLNSTTLDFYVSSDGSAQLNVRSAVSVTSGSWYKIVCWHDETNQKIGISVNDETPVLAAYTAGVNGAVQTPEIGAYNAGSTANGRFDQVSHWNRVLSATDITAYP